MDAVGKLTIEEEVADNCALVDNLGVRALRVDKVLQKVGRLGVKVLVFALEAGREVLNGDASHVGDVGRPKGVDGVLVQPVVQPGHLATHAQVVDGLVCDGQSAVKVAACIHESELLAECHSAEEVPGI